jgi:hypothetical protein
VTQTRRAPAHADVRSARWASHRTALAAHVAGLLPWGPLLAGCCAGIAVTVALRIYAGGGTETPADVSVGVRCSFVPVIAGVAFLLHDPYRQLTGAMPARAWLMAALRVALAMPVLVLSAAIQLGLADWALATDLQVAGQPAGGLPWIAVADELAAWCALALALSAALERTRWHDLAGLGAAVGTLAVVGALAVPPLHLLSTTITSMSAAQQSQWAQAWRLWVVTGLAALLSARIAAGDPWWRIATWLRRQRPALSPLRHRGAGPGTVG